MAVGDHEGSPFAFLRGPSAPGARAPRAPATDADRRDAARWLILLRERTREIGG